MVKVFAVGSGWVEPEMVTETSWVAQEPSPVASAELHSALPLIDLEEMQEAYAAGLDPASDDLDLAEHGRDLVHAHADALLLGRESWLCLDDLCRVGQIDRVDHGHRSSRCDLLDCVNGCEHSHG